MTSSFQSKIKSLRPLTLLSSFSRSVLLSSTSYQSKWLNHKNLQRLQRLNRSPFVEDTTIVADNLLFYSGIFFQTSFDWIQRLQAASQKKNAPRSYPRIPIDVLDESLQEARRQYEARQQHRVRFNVAIRVGMQEYSKRLVEDFQKQGTKCLHAYTTDKYTLVNRALRTGTTRSAREDIREIIEGATRALRTGNYLGLLQGYKPSAVLYRGCSRIPEVPRVGSTYSDRAFFSTTWKLSVAVRFLNDGLPSGSNQEPFLFCVSNARTAAYVKDYSQYKHEGEFLFPPSTMFRVQAVKPGQTVKGARGKVTIIEMIEMTTGSYV